MALEDDVKQALREAGEQIKKDLWKPNDEAFLAARAKDLVGLNKKALATDDPLRKKGYKAAADDVLNHVKLLAIIRSEALAAHLSDIIGKLFLEKVLPLLIKLLPALIAAL
jgi:hypothetical protein